MRIFIAFECDAQLRRQVQGLQRKVEPFLIKGNATARDNFHITLRFIGEMDEGRLPDLQAALIELSSRHSSFALPLDTTGEFTKRGGKVIWLGTSQIPIALVDLAQDAENVCRSLGFTADERPYTPHLTLFRSARMSSSVATTDNRAMSTRSINPPFVMHIDHITLMHSTRQDDRLVYLPLSRYALNEA